MKSLVASLVLAQLPVAWSTKLDRPFHSYSHRRLRDSVAATHHHSMRIQDHPITRIESAGQEAAIENFADIVDHIKPINAEPRAVPESKATKDESADDSILAAHPELQARVERVSGAKELSKVQQEMIAENLHLATNYYRDGTAPVALAASGKEENKVLLGGILASHLDLMADVKKSERGRHLNQIQEEMIAENIYEGQETVREQQASKDDHKDDLGGRLPLPPLPTAVNAALESAHSKQQGAKAAPSATPPAVPPAGLAPDSLQEAEDMEQATVNAALKSAHTKQQGAVSHATVMQALDLNGMFAKHPELTAEVQRVAPPGSDSGMLEAIAENLHGPEHARGARHVPVSSKLAASSHQQQSRSKSPGSPEMDLVSLAASPHVSSAKITGALDAHPELMADVMNAAPPGADKGMLDAIAEKFLAEKLQRTAKGKVSRSN